MSVKPNIPVFEAVDEQIAAILRRKTPTQRMEMTFKAHTTAKRLVLAGIRHQHPDWSEQEQQRELVRRMLGGTG